MLHLAILGTGGMAHAQAENFAKIKGVAITACCDVDPSRAKAFAERFAIPRVFTDLDVLLRADRVDAVTNVTPDRFHAPLSLKVIAAGKHILCEKPLATNYREAKKMADAARKAGVINMINFSYRNSSALQHIAKRIAKGEIGRIFHVQADYLQSWLTSKDWGDWKTDPAWLWRLSTAHGSKGVLGDVGVHILDFASFPVGDIRSVNCLLKTFDKAPGGRIGDYTIDANDSAIITAEFEGGAVGAIQTTRLATGYRNSLHLQIHGEEGAFRVDLDRSYSEYDHCKVGRDRKTGPWETVSAPATPSIYERFAKSVKTGVNDQPDFARGAAIQAALDACEKSAKTGRAVRLA